MGDIVITPPAERPTVLPPRGGGWLSAGAQRRVAALASQAQAKADAVGCWNRRAAMGGPR
jgi:hypothetical protein